jgi:ubiquinone/menaquinone biosynthesis C-methylase UbiE/uncharacterized protein YbaR (Trm112 family)
MNANSSSLRLKQIAAWVIFAIFVLGFFFAPVGAFTGPVLGVWFVGTQRVRRGFAWMVALGLLFGAPQIWRGAAHAGPGTVLAYLGWTAVALVVGILPFTFHRITSSRLPGFASTLPLPVYAVVFAIVGTAWLPAGVASAHGDKLPVWLTHVAASAGPAGPVFLTYWFAAGLVWAWNQEFRWSRIRVGASIFAGVCVLAAIFETLGGRSPIAASQPALAGADFSWACVAAAVIFAAWALFRSLQSQGWQCRPQTLRILQSPSTGQPLQLVTQGRSQALITSAGERFPIRNGIPDLRRPEDLTGDNGKYNHLYELIGGFYDDIQRVVCACSAMDRDAYVMSYMSLLDVKPGDSVLETSVGTGLNFKYLPKGVTLAGLDLSPEMLANCSANLRRWGFEADLFMGNAESLPFADESFEVVFHVGGINFFNDRGKAIAEMIRVAKPGSKILIADETEEHVKAMYESGPITNLFYRNRKEPVTAPIDLVPPEMMETHLEVLKPVGKNRFYVLTFRKPAQAGSHPNPGAPLPSPAAAVPSLK